MEPIKRPSRMRRRIKVLGEWRGGNVRAQTTDGEPSGKPKKKPRKKVFLADGRMNEVAAAEYVGLSISRLQNLRVERKPPTYETRGRNVFYRPEDLDRFNRDRDRE